MKVTGFTYVRNGLTYGYPFLASIKSILPVVDEHIVVVGDSQDGTREAIVALDSPKVRIIDTQWDMQLREGGKIFAQQSNLGLDQITEGWAFHLQADEVLHENDLPALRDHLTYFADRPDVEGLLFPFYHFWGDYHYIRRTRRTHPFEIRAFKTGLGIRSYRDSQGFRKYPSVAAYDAGEKGTKLKVVEIDVPIYHYSYVRDPQLMRKKGNFFHRFWHADQWLKQHAASEQDFDYNDVDLLERFEGSHPAVMADTIRQKNWDFTYDPSRSTMSLKDRLLHQIEQATGKRLFAYRNYERIARRHR
ncbi:hypothetical protein SAMN05421823_101323 [Catalinimonas alkaloidigena]|uniref:Glycosyl transferase family 2 n=1 Tax=Catalinimonas alkaloidigena TaxID=1075417 RepID=A0A1G8XE10_9BACT|nr:hypothetical protein [Catalinimonas alkaloidigena]SDJ88010.1 hypothetical protein SAMN05421823_101323 [Catalinimonas alkaloidigena]